MTTETITDAFEDAAAEKLRELTDPEKEYGRREPHEVIWNGDYGEVLRVVAQEG